MQSTRLGERLIEWLHKVFAAVELTKLGKVFTHYFGWVITTEKQIAVAEIQNTISLLNLLPDGNARTMALLLSVLTGQPTPASLLDERKSLDALIKDPLGYMTNAMEYIVNNPALAKVEDLLGRIINDVIITPIEDFAGSSIKDPHEFMVRITGRMAAVSIAIMSLGTIAEIVGVGQIQTVAEALAKGLESINMGDVGLSIIEPLIQNTITVQATRYYNERYRMRRWSAPELMQLYALRELSESEFRAQMAQWGYQDNDIGMALHNSEEKLRIGELVRGYNLNLLDKAQLVDFLHRQGYRPEGIEFLIKLEDEDKRQNDLNSIGQIAIAAYKKHLISANQYTQMRLGARIPQERITIELQVADLETKAVKAGVSTSIIHTAYMDNLINAQDARHYLQLDNIDPIAINLLLEEWDIAKTPKILRLNTGSIIQAYNTGIIDSAATLTKLMTLGWSRDDANLQIDIADTRHQTNPRPLSEGVILSALNNGIISTDDALARLITIGYSDSDAQIILQGARLRGVHSSKPLTVAQIVKLYTLDVFGYADAISALIQLGYDEQTAELVFIADTQKPGKPQIIQ